MNVYRVQFGFGISLMVDCFFQFSRRLLVSTYWPIYAACICAHPPRLSAVLSFQCGNAYSFVSLLHSSIHAGHFHQRVMAGYEFHFVSFIIETESDQCVHSNNHLLFSIHTRAHTRTYIPLFSDSLSLSLNYAPRFRYNCTTSQRVIQH